MARFVERLVAVCTVLFGMVYGERVIGSTVSAIARIDPAHLHGVTITGSAFGIVQAAIATAAIVFAVLPAIASIFDRRKMPATLLLGELVAAMLLFGASQHVLRESIHARIVGTGDARVLAVRASAPVEVVE